MTGPSRRAVLVGGAALVASGAAGVAAVETGVLPGRARLEGLVGIGDVDLAPPGGPQAGVRTGRFDSAAMRQGIGWVLFAPQGVDVHGLPLVLALHGRGGTAATARRDLGMAQFLGAHVEAGGRPFAVASVDGGSDTYWHPRSSGVDPLTMITDELLPTIAAMGPGVTRIGVMGWSMGGYGALSMARESSHHRLRGVSVVAAAAASPALFESASAAASGSFDGPRDWDRWGALAERPDVTGVRLHVSCGTGDPFAEQTRTYRAHARPRPAGGLGPGRHTNGYWRSLLPAQLRWFAQTLD